MAGRLPTGSPPAGLQRGFAYLLLLVSIAVLGLAAATTVSIGVHATRRNAEYELLVIGGEFERALASYRQTLPGAPRSGPATLEDLLLDPRGGPLRRHLRKIYADPLTGQAEWGLARAPDGGIVGVYSLAPGSPIKQGEFGPQRSSFAEAKSYAGWVFSGQGGPSTARP